MLLYKGRRTDESHDTVVLSDVSPAGTAYTLLVDDVGSYLVADLSIASSSSTSLGDSSSSAIILKKNGVVIDSSLGQLAGDTKVGESRRGLAETLPIRLVTPIQAIPLIQQCPTTMISCLRLTTCLVLVCAPSQKVSCCIHSFLNEILVADPSTKHNNNTNWLGCRF